MVNKRGIFFVLIGIFLILNLTLVYLNLSYSPLNKVTGKSSLSTGGVIFNVGFFRDIIIHNPLNLTYSFNKSSSSYYLPVSDYPLDLKVSAIDFVPESWFYSLEQTTPRGNKNSFLSSNFNPNISINSFRWSNNLTVYADDVSKSVLFYVDVPNSAPLIEDLSEEIFVCEGSVLSKYFNASDRDEDYLISSISSSDPFFVGNSEILNSTLTRFKITSRNLIKLYLGGANVGSKSYPLVFYVYDEDYLDSRSSNIIVVEKNNAPVISNIGVQTVWLRGDNSIFQRQVRVSDSEDGNSDGGNLSFNLEFLNSESFFDINENGQMYFEPDESYLDEDGNPKVYSLRVCVQDRGLLNPHERIEEVCSQTGESLTSCQNFSLTITNENRPPIIIHYSPLSFSNNTASDLDILEFNVHGYDPDGTVPDTYWYVDGELKSYTSEVSLSEFNYTFGCGISGNKSIKAVITDGLLNDSLEWNFQIQNVECPVDSKSSSGGGGGGGGSTGCVSEWFCENWQICQNLEKSLGKGFLSGNDYRSIKGECENLGFDEIYCGFQIRNCSDLNNCGSFSKVPDRIQTCYFTENPSCIDRIKNCHSGDCEIGIDCGGPCKACPTCSDGIKNQGEDGIDCGGPCPWPCSDKKSIKFNQEILILGLILLILLMLLIILLIKWMRVSYYKRIIKGEKNETSK